jgi:hypothetical protein
LGTAQPSHHVEELLALLAEEEVVMMPGGALIMRLSACKRDMPRLSFPGKLPESAVNCRYPNLFTCRAAFWQMACVVSG